MICSFNYERILETAERTTDSVFTEFDSANNQRNKIVTLHNDSFYKKFCWPTRKSSIVPDEDNLIECPVELKRLWMEQFHFRQ